MTAFTTTLTQTASLLIFIALGYMLGKLRLVPDNTHSALSKLETNLFVPALVLNIFISNFTTDKLTVAWQLLLCSCAVLFVGLGISLLLCRLCAKDKYEQNISLYGLVFPNFGFVGNALVSALFPDIFLEYLIFTLPFWILIYLWGVPVLLMGDADKKVTLKGRLKNFLNPMLICMFLGMLIGILNIPVPGFIGSAVSAAGNCMSPIAMLLTGMTVAHYDLSKILKIKSIYIASIFRLIVLPGLFLALLAVFPMPATFATCALCLLSMPLGLNPIVIPGALGKDTSVGSGMALVSHVAGCITIPIMLMLFSFITR